MSQALKNRLEELEASGKNVKQHPEMQWVNDMLTVLNHIENILAKDHSKNRCKHPIGDTEERVIDGSSFSYAAKLWIPKMFTAIAKEVTKKTLTCNKKHSIEEDRNNCPFRHYVASGNIVEGKPRLTSCKHGLLCSRREECNCHHEDNERELIFSIN